MRLKNFKDYLAKRLDAHEIAEIERQADIEYQSLKLLQKDIAQALSSYMKQEEIGFNELVRRLGISAAQVAKIQREEANLTLATLAHISALLKKKPHLVFKAA